MKNEQAIGFIPFGFRLSVLVLLDQQGAWRQSEMIWYFVVGWIVPSISVS